MQGVLQTDHMQTVKLQEMAWKITTFLTKLLKIVLTILEVRGQACHMSPSNF